MKKHVSIIKSILWLILVYIGATLVGQFVGSQVLKLQNFTLFSKAFVGFVMFFFMRGYFHLEFFSHRRYSVGIECLTVGLVIALLLNNDFATMFQHISNLGLVFTSTVGTALYEEAIFRVVMIFIIGNIFYHSSKKIFWEIYLSSTIFALAHIINMYSVNQVTSQIVVQVLYAFCLGTIFALSYVLTDNIVYAIILHFLVNLLAMTMSGVDVATNVQLSTLNIVMIGLMLIITGIFNYYLLKKWAVA